MQSLKRFYDRYHQKNRRFTKVIPKNNFTYFYILDFLHKACTAHFGGYEKVRVLDVGCGVGTLSLYLAKQGSDVTGLDISPRAIEIANFAKKNTGLKTVRFVQGELKKRTVGEPLKDLVISCEVIEHIADDLKFLQLIHSHLREGGVLFLTTPSNESLFYKWGWYDTFDQEVGHLRRYSEGSLKKLVEKAGFKVQEIRPRDGILRMILFSTKLEFLVRFIRGPVVPFFHLFDLATVHAFGPADLQVVAIKEKVAK